MNLVLCIIFWCSFYSCASGAEEEGTTKCLGDDFFLTGLPERRILNRTFERFPGSKTRWAKFECKTIIYLVPLEMPVPTLNLTCYRNNSKNTRTWMTSLHWHTGVRFINRNNVSRINKVFTLDGTYKHISCSSFSKTENVIEEDLITIIFKYRSPETKEYFDYTTVPTLYRSVVNSDIGIETELSCPPCVSQLEFRLIFLTPYCEMYWSRNSKTIKTNWLRGLDGIRKNFLTPKSDDDFGEYTCQIRLFRFGNYLANKTFTTELVQKPVVEDLSFEDPDLTWAVRSHQPIKDIEVSLKKLGEIEWLTYNLISPRKESVSENAYKLVWEITNRTLAGNIYEAMVKVKNTKAWSSPSYAIIFRGAMNETTERPDREPGTVVIEVETVAPRREIAMDGTTERPGHGPGEIEPNATITTESKSNAVYFICGFSLAGCIIIGLITCYCVWKCKKARQKVAENSHPSQQDTKSEEVQPDERLYAYVPKEIVSHYEARALATGNKKLGEKDFVPSVPLRPHEYPYDFAPKTLPERRFDESNYDYATPSHLL